MLKFSKETDYALQLLQALSEKKEILSLNEFSKESGISFAILQKIARNLKKAQIICSLRGKNGGYTLCQSPKDFTMHQIIEAVEGKFGIVNCLKKEKNCTKEKDCTVKNNFQKLNESLLTLLREMTLEDFFQEAH